MHGARGGPDAPVSSFFICTGTCKEFDGNAAFARVRQDAVVRAINQSGHVRAAEGEGDGDSSEVSKKRWGGMRWFLLARSLSRDPSGPFHDAVLGGEMKDKQAVVETEPGTFVIQLLPDAAPNHVGHFMTLAREGAYAGTIFHRVVKYGIIQGGDPLSKDPAKSALYGTGGHGTLRAEPNAQKQTAGAVSAVLQPGRPDSGGAQFFITVTDQPGLDGQYTVFGRVIEASRSSSGSRRCAADAESRPAARHDDHVRHHPRHADRSICRRVRAELWGLSRRHRDGARSNLTGVSCREGAGNGRNFLQLAAAASSTTHSCTAWCRTL